LKRLFPVILTAVFALTAVLTGCSSGKPAEKTNSGYGVLQFKANGEDFIRQGFTSKDGWNITFDNVYITLAEITGYQTNPPYEPDKGKDIAAETKVSLPGIFTVDLAEGDENAPPILVGEVKDAPAGRYNAISWKMVKAADGEAKGHSLVIKGKAQKDKITLDFVIRLDNEFMFIGGEFIGDERKGILEDNSAADLEMTFHFDHIFGDAGLPADDGLNTGALGFQPFADTAVEGKIDLNAEALRNKLSPVDYQALVGILTSLGHTGEGHCYSEALN